MKIAVSGGFDPLHIGHLRMLQAAKELGTVFVILNNDNWLKAKKGYCFMPEEERAQILQALKYVDAVYISRHQPHPVDMSVCKEIELIRPNIFVNGGDRVRNNVPEVKFCKKNGIGMIFNLGGSKCRSSSEIVKNAKTRYLRAKD